MAHFCQGECEILLKYFLKGGYMSFGKRFREFRLKVELSQTELGKLLGFTYSNISLFERDKVSPSVKTLQVIINKYNLNADWLFTGNGEMFLPDQADSLNPKVAKKKLYSFLRNELNLLENDDTIDISDESEYWHLPISGEIAAGEPLPFNYDDDPMYYIPISKSRLSNPKECDVLRVNGRSMEPKIEHSDLVVIKRDNDIWGCNNKVVAVRTSEGLTLKKLEFDHNKKTALLIPYNQNFPVLIFDEECSLCGYLILLVRQC
jgi:SOS-response transcriptional repressor LexA